MKIFLVIFLYITTTNCGVLKNEFVSSQNSPISIHKRDIQIQNNNNPTDLEEINRLINLAENARNTTGVNDGKNCTTIDDVVICNVYVPDTKIHKREIEVNTEVTDVEDIRHIDDTTEVNANTTVDNATNCTNDGCSILSSDPLVAKAKFFGGCLSGTARADDGTCVEIIDISDIPDVASNMTVNNATDTSAISLISKASDAFSVGCPPGTARAADNTCVEIIE